MLANSSLLLHHLAHQAYQFDRKKKLDENVKASIIDALEKVHHHIEKLEMDEEEFQELLGKIIETRHARGVSPDSAYCYFYRLAGAKIVSLKEHITSLLPRSQQAREVASSVTSESTSFPPSEDTTSVLEQTSEKPYIIPRKHRRSATLAREFSPYRAPTYGPPSKPKKLTEDTHVSTKPIPQPEPEEIVAPKPKIERKTFSTPVHVPTPVPEPLPEHTPRVISDSWLIALIHDRHEKRKQIKDAYLESNYVLIFSYIQNLYTTYLSFFDAQEQKKITHLYTHYLATHHNKPFTIRAYLQTHRLNLYKEVSDILSAISILEKESGHDG